MHRFINVAQLAVAVAALVSACTSPPIAGSDEEETIHHLSLDAPRGFGEHYSRISIEGITEERGMHNGVQYIIRNCDTPVAEVAGTQLSTLDLGEQGNWSVYCYDAAQLRSLGKQEPRGDSWLARADRGASISTHQSVLLASIVLLRDGTTHEQVILQPWMPWALEVAADLLEAGTQDETEVTPQATGLHFVYQVDQNPPREVTSNTVDWDAASQRLLDELRSGQVLSITCLDAKRDDKCSHTIPLFGFNVSYEIARWMLVRCNRKENNP